MRSWEAQLKRGFLNQISPDFLLEFHKQHMQQQGAICAESQLVVSEELLLALGQFVGSEQVDVLIAGAATIDVEEWRRCTVCGQGYEYASTPRSFRPTQTHASV